MGLKRVSNWTDVGASLRMMAAIFGLWTPSRDRAHDHVRSGPGRGGRARGVGLPSFRRPRPGSTYGRIRTARCRACGHAPCRRRQLGHRGLHLIVRALGIGEGDEVLVPSFTFAASVNAFLYEGATPVFVDIEPETYNLDPADDPERRTPETKAVMVVDVFGHPADVGRDRGRARRPTCCSSTTAARRSGAALQGTARRAASATPAASPSIPTSR